MEIITLKDFKERSKEDIEFLIDALRYYNVDENFQDVILAYFFNFQRITADTLRYQNCMMEAFHEMIGFEKSEELQKLADKKFEKLNKSLIVDTTDYDIVEKHDNISVFPGVEWSGTNTL